MDSGPPWQQQDPLWGYGQLPLQARSVDGGGGGGGGGGVANGTGGMLKRSYVEMERQQNQLQTTHLLQQALLMRAVRQKTSSFMAPPLVPSPVTTSPLMISPSVFSGGSGLGSASVSSFSSASLNSNMNMYRNVMSMHANNGSMMNSNSNSNLNMSMSMNGNRSSPAGFSFNPAPAAVAPVNDAVRNQLKELERQLLCDDDDDDEEPSGSGSVITNPDWSETIQQMLEMSTTPSPPAARQVPQLPVIGGGTAAVQNQTLSSSPSNSSSSTASSSASYSPPVSATSSRQLLSDTATAIAEGNLESAFANIAALKRNVNLNGDTEQRLTGMMVTSLTTRINALTASQLPVGNPIAELCGPEQRAATQLLHDTSPCFKLGFLAANLAILDATRGYQLHLIDFDIGTGSQHARLIQALGEGRRNVVFKITVVSDPASPFTAAASSNTALVGERLKKIAERAGVILSFNMVTCRVSELDRLRLGCKPDETLAVNVAFVLSRVPDESVTPANPRDELLRRVRSLGPHIVTLVEHEMNGNTAPFTTRFTEACGYYGAILDSLDVTFGRDTVERSRVEAALARKAVNLVSREGTERVERCELHGKWRARMSMAGLVPIPLGPSTADHLRARLNSVRHSHSFMVKEESGGIGFGYTGRILTMASAWR